MYYEFKQEDAYRFANEQHARTRQKGDELEFALCPYCNGGKHGKDDFTFSINLNTGQFNCFRSSCSREGNFFALSRDFNFSLGEDVERYYNNRNIYKPFKSQEIKSKDEAVQYLKGRGIGERITKLYEITVQENHKNVLVFPFKDEKGTLWFVKYRNTQFKQGDGGNKEWCQKGGKPILFGMKQCEGFDRLIITEGQIDSLSLADAGIKNAVSVPTGAKGFTWVPHCWDWLCKFKELIVFGDCENGKITLLEDLKKRFKGIIRAVRIGDYKGCKDANEILRKYGKQALVNAVNNAEDVPVSCIKKLADVKSVDIYSMPKILTGIKSLDHIIGGLYYGQIILLSGKRGDGKSTLMSQIEAEALEQNQKVLTYSGELNDYYFKRWLDFQLAGKRNISKNEKPEGITYTLTKSVTDRINDWYRDKAYIYDNNVIEDDEIENLLKVVETAIMRYGINLVCIDNLMTALEIDMGADLYRAQSKFVGKLSRMAKQYEVVVLLVAHPRKNTAGQLSADDISGSADIANKVDVVVNYLRDDELPDTERMLTVTKNRLTGKLTKKDEGIRLYYDEVSKRISEGQDEYKVYGWEGDKDGFMSVTDEEIPFE